MGTGGKYDGSRDVIHTYTRFITLQGSGKVVPVHAKKAQWVKRRAAPLILNFGTT
jgi:hypothetical protein